MIAGIREYFNDKTNTSLFELYPNPASTTATIGFKSALDGKTTVSIYNQVGQLVQTFTQHDTAPYTVANINISSFADGVYFVKLTNKNKTETKKLVVSR